MVYIHVKCGQLQCCVGMQLVCDQITLGISNILLEGQVLRVFFPIIVILSFTILSSTCTREKLNSAIIHQNVFESQLLGQICQLSLYSMFSGHFLAIHQPIYYSVPAKFGICRFQILFADLTVFQNTADFSLLLQNQQILDFLLFLCNF